MNKYHKKKFIKKQFYPGGQNALDKFISNNLTYPQVALDNKIEGTVLVAYDVESNGKVIHAKVLKSVGFGCDEEAIRLVKALEYTSAKQRGVSVKLSTKLNIHFKLLIQQTVNVNYIFKPSI